MGKIKMEFGFLNNNIDPGIDFNKLELIIKSLPGNTYITKVEQAIGAGGHTLWKFQGENSNFVDGTLIYAKYKRIPLSLGYIDHFDGVDIIDPTPITNYTNSNPNYTSTNSPVGTPITSYAPITFSIQSTQCDCGAAAIKSQAHSSWCSANSLKA